MAEEKTSITEIRTVYRSTPDDRLDQFIFAHQLDEREGVQKIVGQASRKLKKYWAELDRIENLKKYEKKYGAQYELICGIDEVGRGPLAGPVVAGAVILPRDCRILYINDSKKLTAAKREELYDVIMDQAVAVGIGMSDHDRIDEINILNATYEAMRQAISRLDPQPDLLLNDAVTIPEVAIQQIPLVHGDARSISIGAASIVAKVTRDAMMIAFDEQYPEYGFARNKGYGTADHIAALKKYGPCPIHRKSFITHFIREENHSGGQSKKRGNLLREPGCRISY